MTKEQEEAIERINNDIAKPLYCGDITICNIDDLKTILSILEEKDKQIDLMAEFIEERLNSCPYEDYNYNLNCEKECDDNYRRCWKQYFKNKAKEK